MQRHINHIGRHWDADALAFFKAVPLALGAFAEAAFYRARARRTGEAWDRRRCVAHTVQAAAITSATRWMANDPENIPDELRRVHAAALKAAEEAV
jgi:hypothetical protein